MILDASSYRLEETPWAVRAACRGSSPDVFFPIRGEPSAEAKAICVDCPVRVECLGYAVRWGITHGIWGGLSARERHRLDRPVGPQRTVGPHSTTSRYARGCRCDGCCEAATVDQQLRIEAGR